MWENMVIHMFLGVLATVVKNPKKVAELQNVLTIAHEATGQALALLKTPQVASEVPQ